jgi:hypothetical protein
MLAMALFAVLFTCGLIIFSVVSPVLNNVKVNPPVPTNPPVSAEYSTPLLHVAGNEILTSDGAVVFLRGVDYTYFIDGPCGSWMLPNGQIEFNTWDTAAVNSNLDAIKSWGCNSIRVLATTQWWVQNTQNFQSNLEYFIAQAALRGIYVDFTFWRNSGVMEAASLPYPPYDCGSGVINSVSDFVNVWTSVANTLKGYPNVMFELWNEPNGDAAAEASWFSVTQQCINAIRGTGSTSIIVVQWGSNTYLDFQNYNNASSTSGSMDWASSNPLNDSINNIVYSTHLYSDGFYDSSNNYVLKYSYSDMLWALNVTGLLSLASQHPVWIGEIGCNLWASNMNDEYAWYSNTLTILNQYGIGFEGWAWAPWSTGTQWGLVTGQSNYAPNQVGQIFQQQISGS